MPIEYRPSQTWPKDAGQDAGTVIGTESTILGDEADSARALFTLLAGRPPIGRIVAVHELGLCVKRSERHMVVMCR